MYSKVFIVDDDEISVFLTETLLEIVQFTQSCIGFSCATHAIAEIISAVTDKAYQKLPDIIFLDLNMPHMSGWDFLDRLLPYEEELLSKCQIYILTSSVDQVDMDKAQKYKVVSGFLQKPLDEEIIKRISNS
ncbi:response regulator [Pontibacter sp. H249]|uniref:response regulator n=1 Tax=Pontibacter sp. H249 TaxID=3133420 RepID=UPI0030BDCF10